MKQKNFLLQMLSICTDCILNRCLAAIQNMFSIYHFSGKIKLTILDGNFQ